MDRVVKDGGRIVFGDEGLSPWLKDTDYGKMLIDNNPLYWAIKKKISYLKVLIIQNGWRLKNHDIFDSKKLSLKNKALKIGWL